MNKTAQLRKISRGFTLIELLIVIAVIGILAIALIAAINPVQKLNLATDSNGESDLNQVGTALNTYYTNQGQVYPTSTLDALVTSGELKTLPAGFKDGKIQSAGTSNPKDEGYLSDGSTYFVLWYNSASYSASTCATAGNTQVCWYCLDSATGAMKKETTTNSLTSTSKSCP